MSSSCPCRVVGGVRAKSQFVQVLCSVGSGTEITVEIVRQSSDVRSVKHTNINVYEYIIPTSNGLGKRIMFTIIMFTRYRAPKRFSVNFDAIINHRCEDDTS
jgi:hypothetical protein